MSDRFPGEEWRPAPGFPDYEVSSLGRVKRVTTTTSTSAGRILKASKHYRGYWQHGLGRRGKTATVRLNRLVCEAFHGAPPTPLHEAAHGDGNADNNVASNLRWATKVENAADKEAHGTAPRGERGARAKLNNATVLKIRERRAGGASYADLAADYGVSTGLIGHVLKGCNWTHV